MRTRKLALVAPAGAKAADHAFGSMPPRDGMNWLVKSAAAASAAAAPVIFQTTPRGGRVAGAGSGRREVWRMAGQEAASRMASRWLLDRPPGPMRRASRNSRARSFHGPARLASSAVSDSSREGEPGPLARTASRALSSAGLAGRRVMIRLLPGGILSCGAAQAGGASVSWRRAGETRLGRSSCR